MTDTEYRPVNQEKDPMYNREPGVVIVPGSNYANEMMKFEQFPSKYGQRPGNPYAYRPYPKMLYRAEHWNGKPVCMAAPPDPVEFADPRAYERACESADRVTQRCQRIVKNEEERSRAMEDGWRESPAEAVAYLLARDEARANVTAHRNYEDRNMSELAKREIAQAVQEVGGEHIPEIPEKPRRRGRPRKAV